MLRLIGVVLLSLALILSGCAGKPAGSAGDPRIQEAQKRLPFELVLPTYVPAGYQFDGIHVDDQPPVGNRIAADLVYKSPAGQSLQISESNFAVHIGGSGIVEKIKVGRGDAEYQEITRADGTVRTVAFQVTEKTSATLTTLSLGREELLKVAASMVK